jgi:hypothetical protein
MRRYYMYDNNVIKIIDKLYENREDELYVLKEKEKIELEKLLLERKNKNEELEIAINNIPECFTETIYDLKNKIEEKLEIEHNIDGYYNEKAYKTGFSDAINLIMECKDICE